MSEKKDKGKMSVGNEGAEESNIIWKCGINIPSMIFYLFIYFNSIDRI